MRTDPMPEAGTGRRLRRSMTALLAIVALAALVAAPVHAGVRGAPRPAITAALTPVDLTMHICAKAGTMAKPGGGTLPIWGFADRGSATNCGASVVPTVPGPTLDVVVGAQVTIVLHNALPQRVSMVFPGQDEPADHQGVANGGTRTYTFDAVAPGTFRYEAGTSQQIHLPMGLFGALIVRPTTEDQAYDAPSTAYDVEALVVLSETDPVLSANPTTFNLKNFRPTYWFVNGLAYPDTTPVSAAPGDRVLLRYVNASVDNHTMTSLGVRQRVIARDGFPVGFPIDVVAETFAAGETADVIVEMPAVALGTRFPLYSRQLLSATNANAYPGGMIVFLEAA